MSATSVNRFPDSVHMIVGINERGHGYRSVGTLGSRRRACHFLTKAAPPRSRPTANESPSLRERMRERIWVAANDGTQPRELLGADGDLFGGLAGLPITATRIHHCEIRLR